MEHTGMKGRIQLSPETAEALRDARKGDWIEPREDKVHAKGKGEIQTYFLKGSGSGESRSVTSFGTDNSFSTAEGDQFASESEEKHRRLIEWNVDILYRLLKQCVASRQKMALRGGGKRSMTVKPRTGEKNHSCCSQANRGKKPQSI